MSPVGPSGCPQWECIVDAQDALVAFFSRTLARRHERYVALVSRPKGQQKLLGEFYHRLWDCFEPRHVVGDLPKAAWSTPAYVYGPAPPFGARWPSLRAAYGELTEGQLLVTEDGRFGIHAQEDCSPGPLFIKA